ncbi:hypothetical protein [Mucilaginibacter sp.]|nr:hypothetical protein [Mucilaginibacter sp.]MDR3693746.1 hypothetical protein [Mucilaginibacter sp.]
MEVGLLNVASKLYPEMVNAAFSWFAVWLMLTNIFHYILIKTLPVVLLKY